MRKWFKQLGMVIVLAIMAAILIPKAAYSAPAAPLSNADTPSNWAKAEIERAVELNLVPLRIQGDYKNSITREEFCGLAVKLYEALSGKRYIVESDSPFTDTNNQEVIAANKLGIVNGIGIGKFAPDNTATREEVCVMLYRTLKAIKPDYNISGDNANNAQVFLDCDVISLWAREAAGYLYKATVISGTGDNRFNPGRDCSREEAIVLVKRVYDIFSVPGSAEMIARGYLTVPSRGSDVRSRTGDARSQAIEKLKALIPREMGKPYQWGGTGPNSYDCSGLVYALYGKIGISLPRVSSSQATVGTYVAKPDLAYGDLVFFARDGRNINHVGIYVGNGEFVHAPSSGNVVKATTLLSGYYARTYYTARRVIS
jgi:hypothetical protein